MRFDCTRMMLSCTGTKPKLGADTFGDLLGDHKFTSSKSNEPQSLSDMKRKELEEDMDPDKLRVTTGHVSLSLSLN